MEPGDRRRLAVCVWEDGIPVKRLMSINELRATILTKVKATSPRRLYRKIARAAAVIVSLVPVCFRVFLQCQEVDCFDYVFDPLEPISVLYDPVQFDYCAEQFPLVAEIAFDQWFSAIGAQFVCTNFYRNLVHACDLLYGFYHVCCLGRR